MIRPHLLVLRCARVNRSCRALGDDRSHVNDSVIWLDRVVHLPVMPDDAGRAEPNLGLGEAVIGPGQEFGRLSAIGASSRPLVLTEDRHISHGVTSRVVE
jgi:hypothetical protein